MVRVAVGADHLLVTTEQETVTLRRPTGPAELALVEASGWREWPPRLPAQPIFCPVLNEDYAAKIARDWAAGVGAGLDFPGFHHRMVRARGRTGARRVTFLARWPSRQAAQHARDRVRELTDRSRLLVPVDQVVREVNSFRVLPPRQPDPAIRQDQHLRRGPARIVRGQTPQTQPGLGIAAGGLPGTRPPRADLPHRDHRRPPAQRGMPGPSRMPSVKDAGEPCAGKPHARFDGRRLETEPRSPRQPPTQPQPIARSGSEDVMADGGLARQRRCVEQIRARWPVFLAAPSGQRAHAG
jgi:hypothetical protein